ncbi:class I SAM-dependent methyltransferase [Paenibacillus sp. NEAU-GSW1]|uniref:class I SAM-dependent methyltransferase n=1 Tax=Paenibacillus sp. NEAU-GSW1 TaxID=2682486 RepID=UPI0012E3293F|nr:class I SAM-dependent methyltransferase [Paenibacillus sp. NEAU-GSW1]MUT65931.1 methyltransferase domain-containing protein [Paenibacillus sp. NEAU-GSW1]
MNNPFLSIQNPTPVGAGSYEMALPLITALELKPGMRILEIGAGTGQVAATLAKHWGVTVITLELWESLNFIQECASEQGVYNDVLAVKANAERMPFPDEAFDAVFSIGSFFMIEDREQALKEITRVTRANGYFGIAEPMCTLNPVPIGLGNFDIFKSYKKWLRTLDWNRNLLQSQGFLITESFYFSEGYQWMLDNFRYYDGEKDFILHDAGRWLGLGLAVGKKVRR